MAVNSISDNWNDNLQSSNQEKMKHRYQSFTRIGRQFQSLERQVYADWTSVSFPLCQGSCLIWRIMAKNDEYNDELLCRDFFVGFNFWTRLSFQISEFRIHWSMVKLSKMAPRRQNDVIYKRTILQIAHYGNLITDKLDQFKLLALDDRK